MLNGEEQVEDIEDIEDERDGDCDGEVGIVAAVLCRFYVGSRGVFYCAFFHLGGDVFVLIVVFLSPFLCVFVFIPSGV